MINDTILAQSNSARALGDYVDNMLILAKTGTKYNKYSPK